MQKFFKRFIFLIIFVTAFYTVFAQTDSLKGLGLRLNAQAFFDNKEFAGAIKKGYTLPGFFLQPTIDYGTERLYINAGIHAHYLAGADSTNLLVPILTLNYKILPTFFMQMGVLPYSTHGLPEQLYKPERLFMDPPNIGVEFDFERPRMRANLWINWERYIKLGSPFQEQFMFGLVVQYRQPLANDNSCLHARLFQIVTHAGGQIDSTHLPVTTISNTGINVACDFNLLKQTNLCLAVSGFYSIDASPNPHLPFRNGQASYAHIALSWPRLNFQLGLWNAVRFINPRGEELYGCISTINSDFNRKQRNLVVAKCGYDFKLKNSFEIVVHAGIYADLNKNLYIHKKSGRFEYFYTLIMKFNNRLYHWNI